MTPRKKKQKKKKDNVIHIDKQRLEPSAKLLHLRVNLLKNEDTTIAKLKETFQAENPLVKAMTLSLGSKDCESNQLLDLLKVLPKNLHGLRVKGGIGYYDNADEEDEFPKDFWREFGARGENQLT